uniref:Uncharacterized protein LOC104216713 n=1 Tax=Nicotiana sylvestris TaxID=4096 RepID=A0A1U7VT83_NICSY|nr:PREDICTED: uncharacterized protein LOC104216713 [Nicotiana sylvestris]
MFISLGCIETQATELIGFRLKSVADNDGKVTRRPEILHYRPFLGHSSKKLSRPSFCLAVRWISSDVKYAPNLILTEREKVGRFIEGLNPHMANDMTSHQDDKSYLQVVNIATHKEAFDKITMKARDNIKKSKRQAPQGKSSTSQGQPRFSYPICPSCSKRHPGKRPLGQKGCFHCHEPSYIKRDCSPLGQAPGKSPTTQASSTGNSIVAVLQFEHLILKLGVVPKEAELMEEAEQPDSMQY